MSDKAEIEIEQESDNAEEEEPKPKSKKSIVKDSKPERLTITKKKVKDLSDAERKQLIDDAQNNIENDFFEVKRCKNGSSRICLKKQSKAQQILSEAAESNQTPVPTTSRRYYTDNQLLMEHIINLESSFNQLRSKHKKLKKRYNELETYLYADDEAPAQEIIKEPAPESIQEPIGKAVAELNEPNTEQEEKPPQPSVQRRFVKSWRQLGNQ